MLCGMSRSLSALVVWRLVQGAGGAALLSTAQATLRQIFPEREQGMVQSIFLLGVIVAPTLGPTLGGWITDNASWHWCFFINLPIGLVSAFLVVTFLHDPPSQVAAYGPGRLARHRAAHRRRRIAAVRARGRQSEGLVLEPAASSICRSRRRSRCAMLIWWQLSSRNKAPVIQLRVLKNRDLVASILLFVVLGFGLYGGVVIFPLFTQTILGFSPTQTGLAMMPGGIATAVMALVCGRLLTGERPLVDPRILILSGMALMLFAMWTLGAPVDGRRRVRRAVRADHARAGAGAAVHADQQRGLRQPEAAGSAAGVRA